MLISESSMTYYIHVESMFYGTELLQVMEGGVQVQLTYNLKISKSWFLNLAMGIAFIYPFGTYDVNIFWLIVNKSKNQTPSFYPILF
jgi:hypothetical protein